MGDDEARRRLNAERDRLNEVRAAADRLTTAANESAVRELSTVDQHPAEQASETMERELDMGVLQSVDAELAEVDAALRRLEDGTYGRCELCGNPIGDERLEAKPAARYCVADQARAERDPSLRS